MVVDYSDKGCLYLPLPESHAVDHPVISRKTRVKVLALAKNLIQR